LDDCRSHGVVLAVWWIRLRSDSIARAPVIPILTSMLLDDSFALYETVIDEATPAEAPTHSRGSF
jgi:hypothetical protein